MKRYGIYLLVSLIGFFIASYFYSSNPRFGFPYAVYLFPFDCGFGGYNRDPNYMCEGFLWPGVFKDAVIWIIASVLLVQLYNLRSKLIPGKKLMKIILLIGFVIAILGIILIVFNSTKGYMGQDAMCGGFEGKICPAGYYCPDSRYPDELKKCVSFLEFFKRR
jgi:hypothetical protein